MLIATDGRNPSLAQYVIRGLIFFLVLVVVLVLLMMRYQGRFTETVAVTAELTDVGDGLINDADVRYNGLVVGSVTSVELSDDAAADSAAQLKSVNIDIQPAQATGIPADVTARTVPSNLFGVNSVELVPPADPGEERLTSGAVIEADTSLETITLQDAQNELRTLLRAVPPEELAAALGTIAEALRGGGAVFGTFVPILDQYWEQINAQFPPGAPPGFSNFNESVQGLAESAPELLDTLGRSVIPARTLAEQQNELTALLSAGGGFLDEVQALFAQNPDGGKNIVRDLNTMLGAITLEPRAMPQAIAALNDLAARVLTVFTGTAGRPQLNVGVNFGAFERYTRQNCPVYNGGPYGQLRGPGCVGPGTGTGPTSSGPLSVYPEPMRRAAEQFGAVTTASDNKTLSAALQRDPTTAETLMLGPLVQSVQEREAADGPADGGNPGTEGPGTEGPDAEGAAEPDDAQGGGR